MRFSARGTQLRSVRYNATESTAIMEIIKLKNNPNAQYINVSKRNVVSESNGNICFGPIQSIVCNYNVVYSQVNFIIFIIYIQ